MKILLLGAGGFIGANLTERLVGDGQHEITALNRGGETRRNGGAATSTSSISIFARMRKNFSV